MKNSGIILTFFFGLWPSVQLWSYDVSLVGSLKHGGSLTRLPIIFTEMFKKDLKINFFSSEPKVKIDLTDLSSDMAQIALNPDKIPGNVALLTEHLWYVWDTPAAYVPPSKIKLALSMLEATKIPEKWVSILNNQFDAVIVPDPFLIQVYTSCGVKIPIFCIPLGMFLDDFLERPVRKDPGSPFTFGISAYFCASKTKNQELLLRAFQEEFGNDPKFRLKLHGRGGDTESLVKQIRETGATNIEIIVKNLNQKQYVDFLCSLDCYALISKGEGFSITPREALALGIPCILSKNTAHITICNSGYVKAVDSNILEPADYRIHFRATCGNKFNCKIEDVRVAMREVYQNYHFFREKALQGREWVKQYDYRNLKSQYLSILKPHTVLLGEANSVKDGVLTTNSELLYKKYLSLLH